MDLEDVRKYLDKLDSPLMKSAHPQMELSTVKRLDDIVSIIDQKTGDGLEVLKKYVETGNRNLITRTGDARSIISEIDLEDVRKYLNKLDSPLMKSAHPKIELPTAKSLDDIVSIIDHKTGDGLEVLKKYVETGNRNLITRTGDARSIISEMDLEDVRKYLETRSQPSATKVKTFLEDVQNKPKPFEVNQSENKFSIDSQKGSHDSPDIIPRYSSENGVHDRRSANDMVRGIKQGESVINSQGVPLNSANSSPRITPKQVEIVNQINDSLHRQGSATLTIRNTTDINAEALSLVEDLSRVKVKYSDGLGDSSGMLKPKYQGKQKYIDRITYSGPEMKSILEKLDYFESKVDMNLPKTERAKQIYDMLSTEIKPMYEYSRISDGHKIAASLRGLTSNNTAGKEGLVCAGYASVYKELCERVGIECEYVRGKGVIDPLTGHGGGHAWNVIHTEDGYIPVDVCWGAISEAKSKWFGTSQEFIARHIADPDELYRDYSSMLRNTELVHSVPKGINPTTYSDIQIAINIMDRKQRRSGYGLNVLKQYLRDGDSSIITRTAGTRDFVTSLDKKILQEFLKEVK